MIFLIRHGQTEFNREGRLQGRSDSPLTEVGRRQAAAFGAVLSREVGQAAVWTSPLARAAETARIVAGTLPGAEIRTDARLAEASFGQWEGMTRPEIDAGWPGLRKQHPPRQWKLHAPGGERLEPLMARLGAVLADAAAEPGDVILVSHGIAGRLIRGLHAGLPLTDTMYLGASQDLLHRLRPGGQIDELPAGAA